jgi:hypothetical protein
VDLLKFSSSAEEAAAGRVSEAAEEAEASSSVSFQSLRRLLQ